MGFLHEHKISLEKDFQALLQGGKTVTIYPLRFLFLSEVAEKSSFQVAISVSKKKFHNAVDRNTVKRRIREAVRHTFVEEHFAGIACKLLIVYCDKVIVSQQEIEMAVGKGLSKLVGNGKNS